MNKPEAENGWDANSVLGKLQAIVDSVLKNPAMESGETHKVFKLQGGKRVLPKNVKFGEYKVPSLLRDLIKHMQRDIDLIERWRLEVAAEVTDNIPAPQMAMDDQKDQPEVEPPQPEEPVPNVPTLETEAGGVPPRMPTMRERLTAELNVVTTDDNRRSQAARGGQMTVMGEQARAAINWVFRNYDTFDTDMKYQARVALSLGELKDYDPISNALYQLQHPEGDKDAGHTFFSTVFREETEAAGIKMGSADLAILKGLKGNGKKWYRSWMVDNYNTTPTSGCSSSGRR